MVSEKTKVIPTKRNRLEMLRNQLINERSTFISHWQFISRFIRPRRARFTITDVNKGDRRNREIIDATASFASRTLRAGMMAGVTSPGREWFQIDVEDKGLSKKDAVKKWCHEVTQLMSQVFEDSNLYQTLPIVYGDIGDYGTSALHVDEDFETVVRFYPYAVGLYALGLDAKNRVAVFMRDYRMTVRQVVEKFGKAKGSDIDWSRISTRVKGLYENGSFETWIDICHVIEPNIDFDPSMFSSRYKRFYSVHFERGGSSSQQDTGTVEEDRYLSEAGYDYFPVLAPRWEVTDEGVYGTDCPGMLALGDTQQLQHGEKTALKALEKMVNPPLQGGPEFQNKIVSLLPGAMTVTTGRQGSEVKPIHEMDFRVDLQEKKQESVRDRIKRAYMEDFFLMMSESDRREITATEVQERKEEKLVALGPTYYQLNQDLLNPLIKITYEIMTRQGKIPPLPQELLGEDGRGANLKIKYVSLMAQAQKAVGLSGLERFSNFAAGVFNVFPEAKPKVNANALLDSYADGTGVPPKVVRSDEDAEAIQQQQQQAAAAQAQQEQMAQAAKSAQTLSQTDTTGDNALTRLMAMGTAGQ
jgi:hypothetical protein